MAEPGEILSNPIHSSVGGAFFKVDMSRPVSSNLHERVRTFPIELCQAGIRNRITSNRGLLLALMHRGFMVGISRA